MHHFILHTCFHCRASTNIRTKETRVGFDSTPADGHQVAGVCVVKHYLLWCGEEDGEVDVVMVNGGDDD